MEFMYCIPDLEVFIDKTIKKCLLEYDLDANDTEAVLDDMEKAWPKSPPRPPEKQVLKDCNDNTEKGRRCRHRSGANQVQETVQTIDKGMSKNSELVLPKKTRELDERLNSNVAHPVEVLTNGKSGMASVGGECNRSATSSPDVGDGKSQLLKHSKLKSRLQQRYFEDHETKYSINETADEFKKRVPSNLDLLASAANIHTVSNRGTEEHRIQAIRRLQEDTERHFQDVDSRSCQKGTTDGPESAREMPVLTRLVSSPSTPTRSHPVHYNIGGSSVVSGPYINSMRASSQEPCPKLTPGTPPSDDQLFNPSPSKEDSGTSIVNIDKAKRLLQHYQNGYHAVIPPETVVIRRQLSSSDEVDLAAWKRQPQTSITHPDVPRIMLTDLPDLAAHYHHLATHPHYLQHNQHHHHHTISDNLPEPFQLHGSKSRIASIIMEELQKDNAYHHNTPSRKTVASAERVIPTGMKYSAPQDLNPDKPQVSDRTMSGKPRHHPPQISQVQTQYEFSSVDSVIRTHSGTMPQLLPAHLVKPAHISGISILAFHLGNKASSSSSSFTKDNAVITDQHGVLDDIEQPQDLSIKSRRNMDDRVEHSRHSCTSINMDCPVTESQRREYFSSPNSPLPLFVSNNHTESLTLQTSSSPSNNSDRECDYNSGHSEKYNRHKSSGKWERTGQVHSLDLCPTGDSRVLVEKRRVDNLKRWSNDAGSETSKKRKME